MEEQMKSLVNILKERINYNLQIIKENEENIRKILSQPVSNERSELLKEKFNINKKLLEENHDSLVIELQLINYLGKFREILKHQTNNNQLSNEVNNEIDNLANEEYLNESNSEQIEKSGDTQLLNLTILGEIPFNSEHPRFNDEVFFENLLENYKSTENYEMCSHLLRIKGRK